MTEIPQIVEDLYNDFVTIPDEQDWPDYLNKNALVANRLYSFYYGLRLGFRLSNALREEEEEFNPDEE